MEMIVRWDLGTTDDKLKLSECRYHFRWSSSGRCHEAGFSQRCRQTTNNKLLLEICQL